MMVKKYYKRLDTDKIHGKIDHEALFNLFLEIKE
jgi:hypothetical protein